MIRKLRVKLVCILMALLTVMLGVTFGLVLHFTQQSLEAESLRTLEALANNWQTASSPGLDDGTRVPVFRAGDQCARRHHHDARRLF